MELSEVKAYLRIDEDLTEDDTTLLVLMNAAKEHLESETGKKFDESSALMKTFVNLYVKQLYECNENKALENALFSIARQIQISTDFEEAGAT